jgi:hypothetical protein
MTEPRKLSPSEERAQVRRDNAFRDLAAIVNKIQAPMLAVVETQLMMNQLPHPVPVKVLLPSAPIDMAQMLAQLWHKTKQLEICINVINSMILEKELINIEEYHNRCAKEAEETARVMTRGLLSQGQGGGGIIQRSN